MSKSQIRFQVASENLDKVKEWAGNNNIKVTELIAGAVGEKASSFSTSTQANYRYDSSRKSNSEDLYDLWRANPVLQNRTNIINSLIFGNGINIAYSDTTTKEIVDRFWRINRLEDKLDQIGSSAQLFGEIFVGVFPQKSGDLLVEFYDNTQVDIDFNPMIPSQVMNYILSYKDEDKEEDVKVILTPIETYLNEIEFSSSPNNGKVASVKKSVGLNSTKGIGKGLMAHVKFNSVTSEVYGTSDFYSTSDILQDYFGFVGDRLTVHQLYGSPIYDITIDTDNPQDIIDRIEELDGFTIGSNPVHSANETWQMLNGGGTGQGNSSSDAGQDNTMLQSIIASGLSVPISFLFQKVDNNNDIENTFAMTKFAKGRQTKFRSLFNDLHKVVVSIAGGDISTVKKEELIFPEIDTSSQKQLAETLALRITSNITSRQTACTMLGLNWEEEKNRILAENEEMKEILQPSNVTDQQKLAGQAAGETGQIASKGSNTTSSGTAQRDKNQRNDAGRVSNTSAPMTSRKGSRGQTTKVD